MSEIDTTKQEILEGSSRLYSVKKKEFNRTDYMIHNMESNKAFLSLHKDSEKKSEILAKLKKDYKAYRDNWVNILNS